jgi:hypothetical protein
MADMAWWTGWTKREVQEHVRSLGSQIEQIQDEGLAGSFWIHARPGRAGTLLTHLSAPTCYLAVVELVKPLEEDLLNPRTTSPLA